MNLKSGFDESVALAQDYLAGKIQGGATATQVLRILCRAGGNAYHDGAEGAYFGDCIERRDELVEALLLHAGVILEGDPPRRRPAPFTVGGTDEPTTRPVTPRELVMVQDMHVRYLLVQGIDPSTKRPACWPLELNRTLELHARAGHAGCRRSALLNLLRGRCPIFLSLLQHATGIKA